MIYFLQNDYMVRIYAPVCWCLELLLETPSISKKVFEELVKPRYIGTNKAQSVAFSYLIDKNGETILQQTTLNY